MLMPRMDGLTLAREVKARADLPIIVLSAIDTADSKADLLDEVAEDYVTKPYHYPELRARIQRVLRRLGDRVPRQRLELGPKPGPRAAPSGWRRWTARSSSLTPTESRLLYALAANLGQTVTTETLLARGWADTEDADPSYVWVTMRRLRQKVEVDPNRPVHLLTVRGIGYRLVGRAGLVPRRRGPSTARRAGQPARRRTAGSAEERIGLAERCRGPRRRATPSTASHRAIRSRDPDAAEAASGASTASPPRTAARASASGRASPWA